MRALIRVALAAGVCAAVSMLAGCAMLFEASGPRAPLTRTSLDDEPPRMVSAFFGLEALPMRSVLIWWRAPGKYGMPVTFSRRVEGPIEPEAFTVITESGARLHPRFATTVPANEPAERHTVLLIGELGDEPGDPPATVKVTGSLALEGDADANGLAVRVTPLADGPTLVLAYAVGAGAMAGACPPGTKQVVVATWAGGVRRVPGVSEADHRRAYSVATADGNVTPIGIGNLGDGDNYEHLYLDTDARVLRVSMKEGVLMDPRDDPNPATTVGIAGPSLGRDEGPQGG